MQSHMRRTIFFLQLEFAKYSSAPLGLGRELSCDTCVICKSNINNLSVSYEETAWRLVNIMMAHYIMYQHSLSVFYCLLLKDVAWSR